jgi:hypothetical protein
VLRNHVLASPDADVAAIVDHDRFGCRLLVVNSVDVTIHIDGVSVAGGTDPPMVGSHFRTALNNAPNTGYSC